MIALALAQTMVVALGALLLVRAARRRRHFVFVALTLQALSMLWAMAVTPARYEPYLYARGGIARTVQVLATSLGPSGVGLLALVLTAGYLMRRTPFAAAALVMLVPAHARADVVLVTAPTFPFVPKLGTSIPNAYVSSPAGLDHQAIDGAFVARGYDVRVFVARRSEPSVALLFVPIIDTPLARVLAPGLERAAHAGDPARDAIEALALPHVKPLFLDVRFDASYGYVKYTDRERDVSEGAQAHAAALAIDAAAADIARHVTGTVVFTADHGTSAFDAVPLVVRGQDAADWLGLEIASPTHIAFVRCAPMAPTGLPMYMVNDGHEALVYRPERTGVTYTRLDPRLQQALWARLHAEGLVDQEGYALPPPPLRITVVDVASGGVAFTDARGVDEALPELHALEALTDAGGPNTIRVSLHPLTIAAPGFAPRTVSTRVGGRDIAPTLRELLGLDPGGVSLVPLMRGERTEERAILTAGHSLYWGRWHLVMHGSRAALYDVDAEDLDVAQKEPAVVEELRARLVAAEFGVPIAGSRAALETPRAPVVHLRFAGAGAAHRISGTLHADSAEPIGMSRDAYKTGSNRIEVAFMTSPTEVVGLDVFGDAVTWELYLDDAPWPSRGVFLGCHGVSTALTGVTTDEARLRATCPEVPPLDPRSDLGMLVTR